MITQHAIRDLIQEAFDIENLFAQYQACERHERGKSEAQLSTVPVHERAAAIGGRLRKIMQNHKRDMQRLAVEPIDELSAEFLEHERQAHARSGSVTIEEHSDHVVMRQGEVEAIWEK